MASKLQEYQRNVEDCRRRAEEAKYDVSKSTWLLIAQRWQRLVEREQARTKARAADPSRPVMAEHHDS
jgi:hypothetical protein